MIIDACIQTAMMFRLLFGTQDDRHEPELARFVADAIVDLDDESAAVTLKLAAMDALRRATPN